MVRKDEGRREKNLAPSFLNKPMKNEFPESDPFAAGGIARRFLLFSYAIIFALAFALRCSPDPVKACEIMCGENDRDFDGYEIQGRKLYCYCYSKTINDSLRFP
jgi:hypothetical protein